MSNQSSRLIGSAIIVAGGVIAIAVGSLPQAGDNGGRWGGTALFVGGLFFFADWLKSWWPDHERKTSPPPQSD